MKKVFALLMLLAGCPADVQDVALETDGETDDLDDRDFTVVVDPQHNPIYYMPTVGETNDKCCPTGNFVNCLNDTNNTCPANYQLTACFGCDGTDDDGCSPKDFGEDPWVYGGVGIGYFCSGLAFRRGTNGGQLVHDVCSQDACFTNYGDGGVCTHSLYGNSTPHGCADIDTGAVSLFSFEGTITRMCCQQEAGTTNYECTPRSSDQSCAGLAGSHTTSAYCMPCQVLSAWNDPDGSGTNNTFGAWDLKGTNASNEWPGSIECSQFSEPDLPDWTDDLCLMTEFICRGTLVRSDGIILHDEC